jgi:hypothetical protein
MLERLSESAAIMMTRRYTRPQGRVARCLGLDFRTPTVTWRLDNPRPVQLAVIASSEWKREVDNLG